MEFTSIKYVGDKVELEAKRSNSDSGETTKISSKLEPSSGFKAALTKIGTALRSLTKLHVECYGCSIKHLDGKRIGVTFNVKIPLPSESFRNPSMTSNVPYLVEGDGTVDSEGMLPDSLRKLVDELQRRAQEFALFTKQQLDAFEVAGVDDDDEDADEPAAATG